MKFQFVQMKFIFIITFMAFDCIQFSYGFNCLGLCDQNSENKRLFPNANCIDSCSSTKCQPACNRESKECCCLPLGSRRFMPKFEFGFNSAFSHSFGFNFKQWRRNVLDECWIILNLNKSELKKRWSWILVIEKDLTVYYFLEFHNTSNFTTSLINFKRITVNGTVNRKGI